MGDQPKLYVKVCTKCGRQVDPHADHRLGTSRTVYCDHGKKGPGSMGAASPWKRIEVVAVESSPADAVPVVRAEPGKDRIDFELECGHIVGLAKADVASFNSSDELELPTALACPVCATAEGVFV